ncbi:MAG: phenylalanine--tRNA ligase subunit beta [Pseudomonadota bacterium]
MKFSRRWLEHWLGRDIELEPVLERLTLAGLEVDGSEAISAAEGVVVGHVTEVAQHPDADRLSVAQVDDGENTLEIVCGAPNVRAGMGVAVARIGTVLPGGLKIRKSKLRGVVSHGMLCSARELGLGEEHDGILELPAAMKPGMPLAEALELPDDVIDVDLTPNRGDCFSVLGIAREVATFMGDQLGEPPVSEVPESTQHGFSARVDDTVRVPRFTLRVIEDIDTQATTPLWMVERLRRSGVRAIHPVVDITNYVMLEYGQPMHAYDLDKLAGNIHVRLARPGETLTLLDEREIEPDSDTLLICDDSGPIGLAGIMGGASTGVDENTRHIVFEAALFTPDAMAGQARRYGLHTDASLRFERGVDPMGHARAQARAANLLLDIAGGSASALIDLVDTPHLPARADVTLRQARLDKLLGHEVAGDTVDDIFKRLGFKTTRTKNGWQVTPPSYRYDIAIEEDLIEEVARVYGYDRIPARRAYSEVALAPDSEGRIAEARVRDTLAARGYNEAICYSFIDPGQHARWDTGAPGPTLANPLSRELSVMRGTMLPGLAAAAAHNLARQRDRVRLFELGHVFEADGERLVLAGIAAGRRLPEQWATGADDIDFFDIKADIEALIALSGAADEFSFVRASTAALHPGQSAEIRRAGSRVGVVGALHPRVAQASDIEAPCVAFELDFEGVFAANVTRTAPISRFPSVRRDLAVLVDDAVDAQELTHAAVAAGGALLQSIRVFDIYRGKGVEPGLKSVALGLILQDSSRTLTDIETDATVAAIVQALQRDHGAKLRE